MQSLFNNVVIFFVETDGSVTVKYVEDKVIHRTTLQSVEKCTLQIGDIRHVKWTDGKYYPAMIKKLGRKLFFSRVINKYSNILQSCKLKHINNTTKVNEIYLFFFKFKLNSL